MKWKLPILALLFFALATQVQGLIVAKLPLKQVMDESQFIVVGKIDKVFPEKPAMTLDVTEDLKGKATFRRLVVHLKGDKEAEKLKHVPQILARIAPDLPMVFFVGQKDDRYVTFGYSNGTWLQLLGQKTADGTIVWSLLHGEPYLRRTFKGTTEEMRQVVADSLAKKRTPPPFNIKEQPGFGPEIGGK